MFITWRNFNASTGPVENRFDFQCAHCGVFAAALVRTTGTYTSTAVYGTGGSAEAARVGAMHAANANAVQAMRTVACPQCRKLQPQLLGALEEARQRSEARRSRRVPATALATGIALALGAIPALMDLRTSSTLAFAALGAAIAIGSIAFIRSSSPTHAPSLYRQAEIWFWWHPHPYQPTWTPAPEPELVPTPVVHSRLAHVAGWVCLLLSLIGTFTAMIFWRETFLNVYVVDAEGRGAIKVLVDGKDQGMIAPQANHRDLAFETFTVRRGRTHEIKLVGVGNESRSFTLDDASDGKKGWVVAPEANDHDLCIVDEKAVYSSKTYSSNAGSDSQLLGDRARSPVMPLAHRFDYEFEGGPSSVDLNNGETEKTLRILRGYVCTELENDTLVPYRERKASSPK